MEENEVNTELMPYKNIVNEIEVVSDFVGESEKCSFMKSENFYTWEWFQMYRYKLTDKSSIYYFHYMVDFTPGYVAYFNDNSEFKKDALLNEVEIRISLSNKEVYPIYSWPNKQKESKTYESRFSSDFLFNKEKELHGVQINPIDNKIKLSYNKLVKTSPTSFHFINDFKRLPFVNTYPFVKQNPQSSFPSSASTCFCNFNGSIQ